MSASKEQRQINQVLAQAAQGDETKQRVADKRLVPKQHRTKGRVKSKASLTIHS